MMARVAAKCSEEIPRGSDLPVPSSVCMEVNSSPLESDWGRRERGGRRDHGIEGERCNSYKRNLISRLSAVFIGDSFPLGASLISHVNTW